MIAGMCAPSCASRVMSASGSPSTTMRSAKAPGAMVPILPSIRQSFAPTVVAEAIISAGLSTRPAGRDAIADQLLDLLQFRKAALLLARPDDLALNTHLEDAAGGVRRERHGADLLGKRGQKLLRHPARPETPTTESAVGDFDRGFGSHGGLGATG